MRRLLPTVRSYLSHSGQHMALAAAGLLAIAAAPVPLAATSAPVSAVGGPEAPPVTAVATSAGPLVRSIAFSAPLDGYTINSTFGLRRLPGEAAARHHDGVDIAAPQGSAILSAAEGEVVRIGYEPAGYGRFVELRHANGMTTFYAHLSRVDVASGDRVSAAERIGLVGSTGRSTGPHLHFEVRRGDRQIDPQRILGQSFDVAIETAGV